MRQSKQLLEQALNALPQGFDLRDTRLYIAKAIAEINRLETKRENKDNKQTPLQKWQLDLKTNSLIRPPLTPQQQNDTLMKINDLIKAEEQKIQKLKQQKPSQTDMLWD